MERISQRFIEKQVERVADLAPEGISLVIEHSTGWTLYARGTLTGYRQLAYGRTKSELSAIIDGIETGLRLGGAV